MLILIGEREADARGGARKGRVNRSTAVIRSDGPAKTHSKYERKVRRRIRTTMGLSAHRLRWPETLTALARLTAVPAHRSSRSAAPTAGAAPRGVNAYELLSGSLAACAAMTTRLQARKRRIPLSHADVAVSYHHAGDRGREGFERSVSLEGNLRDGERAQLMQAADMCSVGRTRGLSANIRTNDHVSVGPAANYDDLSELPIPNIDPDYGAAR